MYLVFVSDQLPKRVLFDYADISFKYIVPSTVVPSTIVLKFKPKNFSSFVLLPVSFLSIYKPCLHDHIVVKVSPATLTMLEDIRKGVLPPEPVFFNSYVTS